MLAFGADTPFKWVERAIEFVGQPGRRRCPCLLKTAKYAARAAAMPSSSTSTRAISLPGARPSAWLNSSQPMGCFAPVAAGSAAARLPLRRSAHLRWSACSRSLLDCSVNRASRQSAFMRALRSHFFLIFGLRTLLQKQLLRLNDIFICCRLRAANETNLNHFQIPF